MYISDLAEGVTSKIMKYADDRNRFIRKIKGNGDNQKLQDNIDKLIKWSEEWQMLFKFEKCKCLHTGHGNTVRNFTSSCNFALKAAPGFGWRSH